MKPEAANHATRRRLLGTTLLGLTLPAFAIEAGDPSPVWEKLRAGLFKGRSIAVDDGSLLRLDAPVRADDAAVVPIGVEARFAQSPERAVRRLTLIVDNNPAPVVGTFDFGPASGLAAIETRVRVEEYSHVRAIAELADGSLVMTTRFVKASGGCSAPAAKDRERVLANVGRILLRVQPPLRLGAPNTAQLMIGHPNDSGMAMDQITRTYATPWFVRELAIDFAGQPVLRADIGIGVSENPNFRFRFQPESDGLLTARAVDTRDTVFDTRLAIRNGQVESA
ncbi:quinoprotein dehydrogenase-associated SoxYZ-like carrier [Derxia lacustris]|uniref:quinoprotein dehydrogenase-associated SoxYZ-like carrier n=1 Tax=Derxia lacustris TaxID=764842 RepID=UPI000A172286|nr:quinoprotein dehydrogenase-associated SoxYZ-like carrier [Derxia lacustris]